MSSLLPRLRIAVAPKSNVRVCNLWRTGLATHKRAIQSSTRKSMNSPELAHAHSPPPSPDFLYEKSIDSAGAPFPSQLTPAAVSESIPIAAKVPLASSPAQEAVSEDQCQVQQTTASQNISPSDTPLYHRESKYDRVPYWQKVQRWKDAGEEKFLSYNWNKQNNVQKKLGLYKFLREVLPDKMPNTLEYYHIRTCDDFIEDVILGIEAAPMSIRITPHILANINWSDPLRDPLCRQFVPQLSVRQPDHPLMELDSLHERENSPVQNIVHRYTDKCLFLATSHCPLYCVYCTRAYGVGTDTETVIKCSPKTGLKAWEAAFEYIAATPTIEDVVISGGDCFSLEPEQLALIGSRLLKMPNVRRFRVATKGLCVHPSRILDPNDSWTDELIKLSNEGRARGKEVALHTHFNHPNEITWITREAAQKLFANGVTVRNQSVLLRGVNDSVETMGTLIRELGANNIKPYYVYACDMTPGIEHLRTPLSTLLDIEKQLRGSTAGFNFPQFVVDLPGGGGKRLASSFETYDRATGRSTFIAPAVHGEGKEGKVYSYYDPLISLPNGGKGINFKALMEGSVESQT